MAGQQLSAVTLNTFIFQTNEKIISYFAPRPEESKYFSRILRHKLHGIKSCIITEQFKVKLHTVIILLKKNFRVD